MASVPTLPLSPSVNVQALLREPYQLHHHRLKFVRFIMGKHLKGKLIAPVMDMQFFMHPTAIMLSLC